MGIAFFIKWLSDSKYDFNDSPRVRELTLSQRKGHFNQFVLMFRNFESEAGRTEFNEVQFEIADIFFVVRLNMALTTREEFKLTLNHYVWCGLGKWVDFVFVPLVGIEMNLEIVAACNGRYSFGVKVHGED